jgi:hypothetical protein
MTKATDPTKLIKQALGGLGTIGTNLVHGGYEKQAKKIAATAIGGTLGFAAGGPAGAVAGAAIGAKGTEMEQDAKTAAQEAANRPVAPLPETTPVMPLMDSEEIKRVRRRYTAQMMQRGGRESTKLTSDKLGAG